MELFHDTGGPGIGLFFSSKGGISMMNRSGGATAIGQLLFVDLARADAASVGTTPGAEDYPAANAVTITGGALTGALFGLYCTALTVAADNAEIKVDVYGYTNSLVRHTTGAAGALTLKGVPDVGFLDLDPADTGPVIATYEDSSTAALSTTSVLRRVFLNGYYPLFNAAR